MKELTYHKNRLIEQLAKKLADPLEVGAACIAMENSYSFSHFFVFNSLLKLDLPAFVDNWLNLVRVMRIKFDLAYLKPFCYSIEVPNVCLIPSALFLLILFGVELVTVGNDVA